jgi:putative methionine-R-sulfoxide reductase with GAF domain
MNHTLLDQIAHVLSSHDSRTKKAERIAECIRQAGRYRWVGLYEADHKEITVIAWSGPDAPTYPCFPVTQGLSGDAVRLGTTIVVGNVKEDPRYLTTFENTCSEIVVPIKDARTGRSWELWMSRVSGRTLSRRKTACFLRHVLTDCVPFSGGNL